MRLTPQRTVQLHIDNCCKLYQLSGMTQLTGQEASILAFIARFPDSADASELAKSLSGRSRKIADALIKRHSKGSRDASSSAAARAVRAWAVAG
jgi:hypothetical protein